MPQVTICHPDGSTETIPATVGYKFKRELQQMYKLTIHVERSQAQAVSLTRKQDEIELSGVKRGVLTDIDSGGTTWTLTVRSPEWYATQQAPILGGDKREGDDNALLTTLINSVSEWSAGSIADLTGPMTFVFNHAFANEAMRKIEKNIPGELQWSGDGTVDYVSALGTDKSGSITLSPSEGNLEDGITITDRGRRLDSTHLRVIGAHEGEAQKFAQLVPNDDPQTYENEVRYNQPRWSDASDTDWDRWENKDVVADNTIQEEAAALADELTETHVEAKATVKGEDLSVGDYVNVEKPVKDSDGNIIGYDINRTMRIHRITTKTKQDTTAAVVDKVKLSTRTTVMDSPSDDGRDIQRFNTGFQGSSVVVQGGGSRQPVDASNNAEIPFDYPALEFEHTAVLQVRGLPYRAYSSGAASGGTTTTKSNTELSEVANVRDNSSAASTSTSWTSIATYSPNSDTSRSRVWLNMTVEDETVASMRFYNQDTNEYFPDSDGIPLSLGSGETDPYTYSGGIVAPGNWNGTTFDLEVDFGTGSLGYAWEAVFYSTTIHQHNLDPHTHDPDPGIIEFAGETPSGCDVIINGNTVATNIGSGTFETEVDISGQLTKDAWNDIEVTSDSLGHIQATVSIDGYKQIGTR